VVSDVKLPLGGSHPKKQVYLYGGAIAIVVAYALYKKRQNAATATTADPTQTDPATGYAYGSAEDATALAGQSAYQNPVDYGGGGGPSSGTTSTGLPTGGGFTDNGQWKQAADAYLAGIGLDAGAVSSALGKYLSGEFVNATEKNYVEQAIGSEGRPPVAGANGYPPSIRVQSTGGPVVKKPLPQPTVTQKSVSPGYSEISWGHVPGAAVYVIWRMGHGYISRGSTLTHVNVPKHSTYTVTARNSAKAFDSPAAVVVVN
jgi:hypothetical protein